VDLGTDRHCPPRIPQGGRDRRDTAGRVPHARFAVYELVGVAFLVLVAILLSLDEGTRVALYVAPVWFTILGIGYQIAKPRAAQVA
jgi:L-asparagine transporter-like permease